MKRLEIVGLPAAPLDAATAFHAHWIAQARAVGGDLLLVFQPADHTHRKWRVAAVQELAREAAPRRVNGVASDSAQGVDNAATYLADAHGITGQYLPLAE